MRTLPELRQYLAEIGYNKPNYLIAVEALIFTPDGKLLLEKRGPKCRDEVGKLEGVGGRVGSGDGDDLHEALQGEIKTEIGDVDVAIETILEVRQVAFQEKDREQDWIVVSYLCRLRSGTPTIEEPGKIDEICQLSLDELFEMPEQDLSRSTVAARAQYQAKYGRRLFYEHARATR